MLSPMLYGLYTQFDAQPEKEILFMSDAGNRTETNVSGIKFYFWTQSFGRITGDNVWKDGSPPTFFIDTFLWAFMPWSLLAIWAILWRSGNTLVDVFKGRKKQEWLTLGGFILPFIAFSMSSYKLPHYIFVLFPFAAIITAEFVLRVLYEKPKWWRYTMISIQSIVPFGLAAACILILVLVFPTKNILVWSVFIGLMLVSIACLFSKKSINKVVLSSALAIIAGNWVMNKHFYPELFKYQPSKVIAQVIEKQRLPKDHVFVGPSYGFFSLEFYADHTFYGYKGPRFKKAISNKEPVWVYVSERYLKVIEGDFDNIEVVSKLPFYHISMLNLKFLNPATREDVLRQQYLIKITP
jgi:4-amino-4-deoxy-L-arabinose transferase-like glycosyltransferase